MTSNMLFSVISIYDGSFDFSSIYHVLIILIWVCIATIYQLISLRVRVLFKNEVCFYFYMLLVNLIVLTIFVVYGHFEYVHGAFGSKPTPTIMPIVTLGLVFMFIHNFVIKHGDSKYPTNTSVVTSAYILMATAFASAFHSKNRREVVIKHHEAKHYLLVLLHFFIGSSVTYLLQKYIDFYSLTILIIIICYLMTSAKSNSAIQRNAQ
ncbi:DUF1275 domain-containing protein [Salmonella enterica subsp. enterica serovar Sundsvall]|nr:DUF1275 domain-containing protein [Salmonella enterica subsp. enterica serovar Sundsvall]EEM1820208.1 DUF1275 domain-containing protein [Salmonella enterica subsp. enterica serovar Abaetetuba]